MAIFPRKSGIEPTEGFKVDCIDLDGEVNHQEVRVFFARSRRRGALQIGHASSASELGTGTALAHWGHLTFLPASAGLTLSALRHSGQAKASSDGAESRIGCFRLTAVSELAAAGARRRR